MFAGLRSLRRPFLVMVIGVVGLVAVVAVRWRASHLRTVAIRDWSNRLDLVAEDGQFAVEQWRERVQAEAAAAALAVPGAVGPRAPSLDLMVSAWRRMISVHGYEAVRLVDSAGVTLASTDRRQWPLQPALADGMRPGPPGRPMVRLRANSSAIGSRVRLDVAVRLPDGRRSVVLTLDPERSLFRTVRMHASLSATGEYYLTQADPDGRHFSEVGTAASATRSRWVTAYVRVGERDTASPIVAAALAGRDTLLLTLGERGVPVLARSKPMRGTNWGLVFRVDLAEALSGVRSQVTAELLVVALLFVTAGWIGWRLWREAVAVGAQDLVGFESELRFTQEHLAEAQAIAHLGVWSWNVGGGAVTWAPEIFRILGLPPDTPPSLDVFLTKVHPDDLPLVEAGLVQPLREGRSCSVAHRIITGEGAERVVSVRAQPWPALNGHPARLVGTVQDITELTLAERALSILTSAVEQSADAVLISDRDGVIRYVNPAWVELTGFSSQEAIGHTPRIVRSGRQSAHFNAKLWQTILRGEVFRATFDNAHANGTIYTVEKTITPIRDERGRVTHFVSIDKEVTVRKRVDDALRALVAGTALTGAGILESLVRHVAAALDVSYAFVVEVTDPLLPSGRIVASWLAGEMGPSREYPLTNGPCARVLRGEVVVVLSAAYLLFDGHPEMQALKPQSYYGVPLVDSRGQVIGLLFVLDQDPVDDVEHAGSVLRVFAARAAAEIERLRTERALRRSEELHRSLVEAAPFGIYRASSDGRFLTANPALLSMLGYGSEEELRAIAPAHELYAEPGEWARDERRFATQDGWSGVEATWRRKDGRLVAMQLSGRALLDSTSGRVLEGVVEDVTERRELEGQLRQAQKMEALGLLTGGIAHDFNNLLMVVQFNAELVSAELPAGRGDLQDKLTSLLLASQRGAAMVRKLLAFSRRERLDVRAVQLGDVLRELVVVLRRLVPENIEVCVDVSPSLPQVWADPGAVEQILLNLVTNARDAMPSGGTLTIAARSATVQEHEAARRELGTGDSFVVLTVTDTGVGMDEATQARAFEPFFTSKAVGAGTGLGLAMVYGLVKQMGGSVSLRSRRGNGTMIRVELRKSRVVGLAPAATSPEMPSPRGTETILLVEDDGEVRQLARELLELHGYRVIIAADGREALDLLAQPDVAVDLVLSDVVMPRMGGRELLGEIRSRWPAMRVVFSSGYPDRPGEGFDGRGTVVPLVQKPWDLAKLLRTIRAILDRPVHT
jgi:PAS domain S-box-containing protein